nr:hypothetical protein CJLB15_00035 [Campylobacter phage CJLB-15]
MIIIVYMIIIYIIIIEYMYVEQCLCRSLDIAPNSDLDIHSL